MNNNYVKNVQNGKKNYTEASYKKESSLNRMKPDIIHISPAKSMKGEIYRKFLEEKEIFMSANNELTINIIKGCI